MPYFTIVPRDFFSASVHTTRIFGGEGELSFQPAHEKPEATLTVCKTNAVGSIPIFPVVHILS